MKTVIATKCSAGITDGNFGTEFSLTCAILSLLSTIQTSDYYQSKHYVVSRDKLVNGCCLSNKSISVKHVKMELAFIKTWTAITSLSYNYDCPKAIGNG